MAPKLEVPAVVQEMDSRIAESVAQRFHEAYEALAPEFGYRTREESARPWAEVPEQNRRLMVATVRKLLDDGAIAAGSVDAGRRRGLPKAEALKERDMPRLLANAERQMRLNRER